MYFTVFIFKKDQTPGPPWGRLPIPHLRTGYLLFYRILLWLVPEADEIQAPEAGDRRKPPGDKSQPGRDQGVQKLP